MSDVPAGADTREPPCTEGAGGYIGAYRVLQAIGEGGFGTVFEAEQEHPVRRRVALKVIKLGMDTRDVIARFEAERQALAMMDHPHIARVFDAGATDSGRPYFVMELVKGEPITQFCDRNRLPIDARLALFEQVCQAVQHAHTKGVIHRDIKPSNILVSEHDDRPFAKVIDFGVAKATSARLTHLTLFTAQHQMIGTPLYMSPEQAAGSADIDTRTDIYALGVVLYELLTGTTPFEPSSIRSVEELQRVIREVEPPRPSTRVSPKADACSNAAHRRGTDARRLRHALRGELDWIVMKALEKERARRYETANGLALDVRRYLTGQSVLAAPPSRAYRLGKFVRRHRSEVAAAAALLVVLVGGVVGFAWQADRARRKAAELEEVVAFQADMLRRIDWVDGGRVMSEDAERQVAAALAREGLGRAETADELAAFKKQWRRLNATEAARNLVEHLVLAPALATVNERFATRPAIAAQLRRELAQIYRTLGSYETSRTLLLEVVATSREAFGAEHPETLEAMSQLGQTLGNARRFEEAEKTLRFVLDARTRALGADDPLTLAASMHLGEMLADASRFEEAEAHLRTVYDKASRGDAATRRLAPVAASGLASSLGQRGRFDEAAGYAEAAVEQLRELYGDDAKELVVALNNRAWILARTDRLDAAEAAYRDALAHSRRTLGEVHPETEMLYVALADVLRVQGKLGEAERNARSVVERTKPTDDPELLALVARDVLGAVLVRQGRFVEALDVLEPVESDARRAFGDPRRMTRLLTSIGIARAELGRHAAAEASLLEAYRLGSRDAVMRRSANESRAALLRLYEAWDRVEPGQGHAARAASLGDITNR
jgi:non-specific serine/threonine protein kinase/serine/threonine-protein kinase